MPDIYFSPFYPRKDLSLVVCGSVMIIAAIFVLRKVYKGSKNQFAYTLMSLTIIIGFSNICQAFCEAFRKAVLLPDRMHHMESLYASETFYYIYYLTAL